MENIDFKPNKLFLSFSNAWRLSKICHDLQPSISLIQFCKKKSRVTQIKSYVHLSPPYPFTSTFQANPEREREPRELREREDKRVKAVVAGDPSDGDAIRESGDERDTGEQRERLGTWAKDSSRAAVSDGSVGLGGRAAAANRSGCLDLEQRWLDFGRINSSVFPAVRAATAASSRREGQRDGGGNCTAAASGDGGANRRRNRQRWLRTEAGYGSSYRLDGEASAL